jgi:hypothetical protein
MQHENFKLQLAGSIGYQKTAAKWLVIGEQTTLAKSLVMARSYKNRVNNSRKVETYRIHTVFAFTNSCIPSFDNSRP